MIAAKMKTSLLTAAVLVALAIPAAAGRFENYSDDEKEMAAIGAALIVNYQRCSGYVAKDVQAGVGPVLYELGSEVAKIARVIERESCWTIKRLYETMRYAASKQIALRLDTVEMLLQEMKVKR
jgi:hypothetical protein